MTRLLLLDEKSKRTSVQVMEYTQHGRLHMTLTVIIVAADTTPARLKRQVEQYLRDSGLKSAADIRRDTVGVTWADLGVVFTDARSARIFKLWCQLSGLKYSPATLNDRNYAIRVRQQRIEQDQTHAALKDFKWE